MYTPERLLNHVAERLNVTYDQDLADELGLEPSTICNLRKRRTRLTAVHVLRIHEVTGWTVKRIRELAGDTSDGVYQPLGG